MQLLCKIMFPHVTFECTYVVLVYSAEVFHCVVSVRAGFNS